MISLDITDIRVCSMSTGINVLTFILAWFTLPSSPTSSDGAEKSVWAKLASDLDWVGAGSISVCLALLSYIFAELTYSGSVMHKPENIVLLAIAVLIIPVYIIWEGRQERLARPAMLPNSVWRSTEFTVVCGTVFLVWSWFNAYGCMYLDCCPALFWPGYLDVCVT